jgi:hypothetical protein
MKLVLIALCVDVEYDFGGCRYGFRVLRERRQAQKGNHKPYQEEFLHSHSPVLIS